MSTKLQKIREMKEEAEAIRALLKACDGGPLKSTANYWHLKLIRAAERLEDAAKRLGDTQNAGRTNTSEAAE